MISKSILVPNNHKAVVVPAKDIKEVFGDTESLKNYMVVFFEEFFVVAVLDSSIPINDQIENLARAFNQEETKNFSVLPSTDKALRFTYTMFQKNGFEQYDIVSAQAITADKVIPPCICLQPITIGSLIMELPIEQ